MRNGFAALLAGAVMFTAMSAGAAAAPAPSPRPEILKAVTDCRNLADSAARLACYDKSVSALDDAESQGRVAVVDREQIRTVRRQAFGFRLPSLDMFAFRRGPNEESLDRITAELSGAHLNREGKWVMTTTENGSWVQTDSNELFSEPRHGSRLDVSKGVLGSFFCKVDRQPAIRCQRIG